jgi:hypothetical protein
MFNFRPPTGVPGIRVEVPDDPPGFRVGNDGESQRATPAQFRQPFVDLFQSEPPQFPTAAGAVRARADAGLAQGGESAWSSAWNPQRPWASSAVN